MAQKVKLLKDHTHGGAKFPKGMSLQVADHDANWMVENKVAVKVAAEEPKPQVPALAGNSNIDKA